MMSFQRPTGFILKVFTLQTQVPFVLFSETQFRRSAISEKLQFESNAIFIGDLYELVFGIKKSIIFAVSFVASRQMSRGIYAEK